MKSNSIIKKAQAFWRIQDSIAKKLSVAMLITIATAFILTGYFVYKNTEKLYVQIIEQQLRTQSDGIALQINSLLTRQATIVEQMSINQDIVGYIRSASPDQDMRNSSFYEHMMETLNAIWETDSMIGQVWFGSEEGRAHISNGTEIATPVSNFRERPWYPEAVKATSIYFSEPYIDLTTEELVVSVIKPIKKDERVVGFVGVDLFLTTLPEIMQSYELDYGYTFLLSKKGELIYHPENNPLMNSALISDDQFYPEIVKWMARGEKGLVLTTVDGEKEYVGYSPVATTGWSVGVVIPHKNAMSQLNAYGQAISIFYTFIVLFLVGVIYFLLKSLLREIPVIIRKTRLFSEGHTDVRIRIKSNDEIGQIAAAFQLMFDEIRATMQKIQRDAYYDTLTQLPNRKLLAERFGTAVERARLQNSKVALVMLDLDNFKQINDTRGHSYGDELLKEVAKQFMAICDNSITAFRFGGDEFIVLIENFFEQDQLMKTLEAVQGIFGRSLLIHGNIVTVSASLGATIFPDDGQQLDELLNNADMAMYKAKERGADKLMLFSIKMKETILRRAKIEELLREALSRNELSLHYQPQIEAVSGKIRGFEALLRWSNAELGNVSPVDFIPIAEETGMIHSIGEWVMRTAFLQNKQIHERDQLHTMMSVNISAVQLRQRNFAEQVIRILAETGLDPQYVELEITESYVIESFESSLEILQTLRDAGIRIALDDFGKGYSSLSYLRLLPIDNLKIDKSFIQDMMIDASAKDMTESIVALAKKVGLGIIAEGIELEQQRIYLNECGCDYIQGYLTGRPMPAEQIADFIRLN